MVRAKFIRITEIVKRGSPDIYDGVEISRDKETVTAIVCGPEKDDPIHQREFPLDEFTVKETDKDSVAHYFRLSFLKLENKVNDAEFTLIDAKRKNAFGKNAITKYFGTLS